MQLLDQPDLVGLEALDLVTGQRPELLVVLGVPHLVRPGELRTNGLEAPEGGDHRLQSGELPAQASQRVGIGARGRQQQLGLQVVVLVGDVGQLGFEAVPGGGAHVPEPGAGAAPGRMSGSRSRMPLPAGRVSPSATSACSIETIATSIMSVDRLLVVIIWTRMPAVHDRPDDRVGAIARTRPKELVADGGDDRDEHDPAADHDQRLLPADQAEGHDRERDDDHEELGPAARCAVG